MKKEKKSKSASPMLVEYIIIAVLVIAAIIAAIAYFGRSVCETAGVATSAISGTVEKSCEARASRDTCAQSAAKFSKDFSDADGDNRGGRTSSSSDVRQSMVRPVPLPDDGGPTPSEAFRK